MVGALRSQRGEPARYLARAIDDSGFVPEHNAHCTGKYEAALLKVMLFNDFYGRTQAECVAIYDRAIELSLEGAQ